MVLGDFVVGLVFFPLLSSAASFLDISCISGVRVGTTREEMGTRGLFRGRVSSSEGLGAVDGGPCIGVSLSTLDGLALLLLDAGRQEEAGNDFRRRRKGFRAVDSVTRGWGGGFEEEEEMERFDMGMADTIGREWPLGSGSRVSSSSISSSTSRTLRLFAASSTTLSSSLFTRAARALFILTTANWPSCLSAAALCRCHSRS